MFGIGTEGIVIYILTLAILVGIPLWIIVHFVRKHW